VDLLKLAVFRQEAWKKRHSLVEYCHLWPGFLMVNKARDLQLALVGRRIVASKVDTVGIEPESTRASASASTNLTRKLSSLVVVVGLVGHEHDETRRWNGQEGKRWRWSVDKAIREVHVVIWAGDRWSLASFGDGLGRWEIGLIVPLHVDDVSVVLSRSRRVLTVRVNLPCSPHTAGVGIVLVVLVYILVKVDEVRENAVDALREIAGTGMNGTYPVAEAKIELAFLPWR
jgi:hypothetical protein